MPHRIAKALRNPKYQAALIGVISIILGLGTYIFLISYQARADRDRDLVSVYIANAEIPSGTSFEEMRNRNLLRTTSIPKKSVPASALIRLDQVDGALRSKGLLENGQILTTTFFSPEFRSEVSLAIPQGMLAVTTSIDDVARVGNFVMPGSRVVVFITGASGGGSTSTRVLIPSALVLAIGKETGLEYSIATLTASPLVTLALNPRDAQRLILAAQSMKISLALAYNNDPNSILGSNFQTSQAELFTS